MRRNPAGGSRVPLIQRVKAILMRPRTEWPVIAAEPATIGGLYRNYAMILAAIPPVCLLIGIPVFGLPFFDFPMGYLIGLAVIGYAMALARCYVLALVIDALAPSFGGTKDRVKAFKLAAYSSTAAWVVGIFYLVPVLAALGSLGLYSFYLLYLGLPVLMKVPADKAAIYGMAVVGTAIALYLAIAAVTGQILGAFLEGPTMAMPAGLPG